MQKNWKVPPISLLFFLIVMTNLEKLLRRGFYLKNNAKREEKTMLRALLFIIAVTAFSLVYSCSFRNGNEEPVPVPETSSGPADIIPSKNKCMENCIEQNEIGCKKFDPSLDGLCDSYLQK